MYTDSEKKASNRFSSIKSRVTYNLDSFWSRQDFIKWYIQQNKCYYCQTSIKDIEIFYDLDNSKRKLTRGKSLEVDRLEDKEYTEENCVPACYWCNNAKSDVFSAEEFKKIGQEIGKTIQQRIKKYNKS
jgi:thioredoxin-related protein